MRKVQISDYTFSCLCLVVAVVFSSSTAHLGTWICLCESVCVSVWIWREPSKQNIVLIEELRVYSVSQPFLNLYYLLYLTEAKLAVWNVKCAILHTVIGLWGFFFCDRNDFHQSIPAIPSSVGRQPYFIKSLWAAGRSGDDSCPSSLSHLAEEYIFPLQLKGTKTL